MAAASKPEQKRSASAAPVYSSPDMYSCPRRPASTAPKTIGIIICLLGAFIALLGFFVEFGGDYFTYNYRALFFCSGMLIISVGLSTIAMYYKDN